jgi:hypothetical protein
MTGVKLPVGVLGTSAITASHVAQGTLPFTGIALGAYLAVGGGLVLTGLAFRLFAKNSDCSSPKA